MAQFGVYPKAIPRNSAVVDNGQSSHFVRRQPNRKLTDEAIVSIMDSNETTTALASKFGVCQQQISRIKRRENWKHGAAMLGVARLNDRLHIVRRSASRWKRYDSPLCDASDINQEALISAWRCAIDIDSGKYPKESSDYYIANGAANGARKAIISDQRARNPSLGNGKRIKSSAFVSTAVHDEAVCGKGTATVEACLESAPPGDVDLAIDLLAAVDKLPERLRSVIMRRYVDGTDQDQRDLAETDGVSRAYIGQLEQKALARLRKLLA